MITKVAVENLRGVCRSIDFTSRLSLLTGPNGAGKSTIMDGIQFSVKGTMPGQSAKDNELFTACATGSEMTGAVSFDQGENLISRSLSRDAKGTTSHQGFFSGSKTMKKAALNAVIEQAMPISIVNLSSAFWALSEAKQIAELAKYYNGKDFTNDSIKAAFLADYLPKSTLGLTQFELLAQIEDKIKQDKSQHTATIKASGETIKSLSLQKDEIERPAGTLSEVAAEIAGLKLTASQIRANLESHGKKKGQKEAWENELKAAESALAALVTVGEDGEPEPLKTAKIYQWEMDRCRDEKAKALVQVDQQLVDFAKKVLAGMETAGCDCCPVMILPKQQIKACTPKVVDMAALETEFNQFKTLHAKAVEAERLEKVIAALAVDKRGEIDLSGEIDTAADNIAARLEELGQIEKALSRLADIDSSIEGVRLNKVNAEVGLEEAKKGEKKVAAIRKGMMGAVFAPVTTAINAYLPAGHAVVEVDDTNHLFIGWMLDGRAMPTPRCSLSGGEKAQFDPAMALAMLNLEQTPGAKLLLLEAAEMSRGSLSTFCESLANNTGDDVQVIVAAWSEAAAPIMPMPGWDVIELEYQEVAL